MKIQQKLINNELETTTIYNVASAPWEDICSMITETFCSAGNAPITYMYNFGCFDIETTTYIKSKINDDITRDAFMYIWQFCIEDYVIIGRTWQEFVSMIDILVKNCRLDEHRRFVIYVHNLSFEFQFFRNFVNITEVFALEKRKIVKCLVNNGIEFRCSWKLSNMNLYKFVSTTPSALHWKKSGDLDYSVIRTPSTRLTPDELIYCINDVLGLQEALKYLFKHEHCNVATVPITSTGFVRRYFRRAFNKNSSNHWIFYNLRLSPHTYALLKLATRGGNCHANPCKANQVWDNVYSYDMSSAYPAVMIQCKFPMTPFVEVNPTHMLSIIDNKDKALIMKLTFHNIRIKTLATVPYIPKAKCFKIAKPRLDNGRILKAASISLVITDIDYRIIKNQYDWDEIIVDELWEADYDYLPYEMREAISDQYRRKCELKFGDPYLYMKSKNKINADFGMMLTDICRDEIIYNPLQSPPWTSEHPDIETKMAKYYNSRNSFLSYQWGVWVTAHCRNRLQKAIDKIGSNVIYCDTDSVKFLNSENESVFEELNDEIKRESKNFQVLTKYSTYGEVFQLGIWEQEKPYKQFKTMGAKKYAYTYESDDTTHITVAGLSKSKGGKYITEHGGLDAFNESTVVPAGQSGRTASAYTDRLVPEYITVNGEKILNGSSLAIYNVPYSFSITDEYKELLTEIGEGVLM